MINSSIVVKTALVVGVILALSLGATGAWLFQSEKQIVGAIKERHRSDVMAAVESLEQAQREALERNMGFVSRLIGQIAEQYLYDVNWEGLEPVLRSFMDYPELLAIDVDEPGGKPFASLWREGGGLRFARDLPAGVVGGEGSQSVTVARGKETLGTVRIHYSDRAIAEKSAQLKAARLSELSGYEAGVDGELTDSSRGQMAGFVMVTVLLVVSVVVLLRTMLRAPLERFMRELEGVGSDLTRRLSVSGSDEVGRIAGNVNGFIGELQGVVSEVKCGSEEVATGNLQLAANVQQLLVSFEQGHAQIRQLVEAMGKMDRLAEQVSTGVDEVVATTGEAHARTDGGRVKLVEAVNGMAAIESGVAKLGATIERVAHSSGRIGSILVAINELTEQTNLLALNAAIEAARAGEAGRGFAVVAGEVRTLAERTRASTAEIRGIIEGLNSETETLGSDMQAAEGSIARGVAAIRAADATFGEIFSAVQAIDDANTHIGRAAADQAAESARVYTSAQHLARGLTESGAAVTQVRATLDNQDQRVEGLRAQVAQFRV
ncbi:methyl-accepting chemotaxis protein [Endothiovibrio diazotrophicus]